MSYCSSKRISIVHSNRSRLAAKSNGSGHTFREVCQPTRRKVIANLYKRYNMAEWIDPKGEETAPALHTEESVHDLL